MTVGMLGCGVVGSGVLEIIKKRSDIELKYILVRRDRPELGDVAVRDIDTIYNDKDVDTVIEVMGGLHPAYEYVCDAMRAGKNVVTANKHLVAHYYNELVSLSKEYGVAFRCTPSVGGGIPWLVNLGRVLRTDEVTDFRGIMNGTTNYILDAMTKSGADFADALKDAQKLGYAEPDPSADIDGLDIQRKCVISANIAFGACIPEDNVPAFGIRSISAKDIAAAKSLDRICKIMAFGKLIDGKICAYVEPTFVAQDDLESSVPQNRNLISFNTLLTGRESFFGQGAGSLPTGYNVVQDVLDIKEGKKSFYTDKVADIEVDNGLEEHSYYVRCAVEDKWLQSVTVNKCGDGIITKPVSVETMHKWAQNIKDTDSSLFFGGILE